MGRLVVGGGVAALGGDMLGAALLLDAAHLRRHRRGVRALWPRHTRDTARLHAALLGLAW